MSGTAHQPFHEYPPGLLLWIVVNQKHFIQEVGQNTSYADREGAEVDDANLIEALKPFNVDLRIWHDLKLYGKEGILDRLKTIYDEVESQPDKFSGLVFLGMSHGEQVETKDYFVTSDCKWLLTEKVTDLFQNCFCSGLKNKPKFYMWNMCRGDRPNADIEQGQNVENLRDTNIIDMILSDNSH